MALPKPVCLLLGICTLARAASEPGIPTHYMGGTLGGCPDKAAARLYIPAEEFVFRCGGAEVHVAYSRVTRLQYGQTLHTRYGTAAGTLAVPVLWPVGVAVLLKRSHKHFVTVQYTETDGTGQAIVMRVEKNDIRPLLATFEAHTGRKFEYEDKDARKSREGAKKSPDKK